MTTRRLCAFLAGACLMAPLRAQPDRECREGPAAEAMAKGTGRFKQGEYARAAEQFRIASESDAGCTKARLWLGTAYMQQFIPGADSPDNRAMASAAREQFDKVLEQEPENELALASIASLCFNQKKLDEAVTWYKKLILVKPDDKQAFYTLGVIAWTRSFEPIAEARKQIGLKPDDSGPIRDEAVRATLRANWLPIIGEGMDNLNQALALDAEYDDAMAYLNLLYREKAELEDSLPAYRADMAQADAWFQKIIEIRKAKASRKP